MEELGLVITLRGRHFSQLEAACNAESFFECLLCAWTIRAMFAHDGGRMRLRRASATGHFSACPG